MRIATANNNRRRLVRRARRAAALKRWVKRAGEAMAFALDCEERPWFRLDLAAPDTERTIYGGGLGGGKSIVMAALRERMARDPIKLPPAQVFYDDLMTFGQSAIHVTACAPFRFLDQSEFEATYPIKDDGE